MMQQLQTAFWIDKPPRLAVGLRWQGAFAEAGHGAIRPVLVAEIRRRLDEVSHKVRPDVLLGLRMT